MDKSRVKEYIASRAARELRPGEVVSLGIGIPTLIPGYLPAGMDIIFQADNGIVGAGPQPGPDQADQAEGRYIIDAGGNPATVVPGGAFIDAATSFGLIRGSHVDCAVLGALEVDQQGDLANWFIPGGKTPGMGGAMDLVVGARRVVITMEHTVQGRPRIVERCTLPLTAVGCVDLIITEMAVIEVTGQGLLLKEYNPEYTIEQIRSATGARLHISPELKEM